jgi:hypothetical protein
MTPTFVSPHRPRSAGRKAAIALGSLIALLGTAIAIGGGAVLALFGSDGVVTTGHHDISTPTAALVSGVAAIDDAAPAGDVLGTTRVRVSSDQAADRPVFVGVGPAAAVDRYLAGAATDEVTDFDIDPFTLDRNRHAGSGATPGAPGDQSFWVARDTSDMAHAATIDWRVRDGNYRVVVMNADGSRGVATSSAIGVKVPHLPAIGLGILLAGALVTAGGLTTLLIAARRPRG